MCLRVSQVLDRDGNTSVWTKVETKASFQNKLTFGQRWKQFSLKNKQDVGINRHLDTGCSRSPFKIKPTFGQKLFRINPVQTQISFF